MITTRPRLSICLARATLAAIVALTVSACSSNSTPTHPATRPTPPHPGGTSVSAGTSQPSAAPALADPCRLITQADAATAIGAPPSGQPKSVAQPFGIKLCTYTATGQGSLGIAIGPADIVRNGASVAPTPVPGLGDEAIWSAPATLYVRHGKTGIEVDLSRYNGNNTTTKQAAITLARTALTRL